MNLEDMSKDELLSYISDNAGGEEPPAPSVRTINVEGMEVTVYPDKMNSWGAFRIATKMDGSLDAEKVGLMLQLVALVTDTDEDGIVEYLGGEDVASVEDVIRIASLIVAECAPKNS